MDCKVFDYTLVQLQHLLSKNYGDIAFSKFDVGSACPATDENVIGYRLARGDVATAIPIFDFLAPSVIVDPRYLN